MTDCLCSIPQAQAKDTISAAGDQRQDPGEHAHAPGDPGNTSARASCQMDGKVAGAATPVGPQPQEATMTEQGLNVLGKGTSCGTFESTTGSRDDSQEQGKQGALLSGGLAVALSGHWRTAEMQFVDTARRVRSKFRLDFGQVCLLMIDVCLIHGVKIPEALHQ